MAPINLSRLASQSAFTLPSDHVASTARRLGIAASLTAFIHLVYIVLYQTLWSAQAHAEGLVAALIGLCFSGAVALYLLTGDREARRVAAVGITYEILLTFTLAVSDASTLSFREPSPQVAWGAVVIVLFPFLLPAPPLTVLAASLASAAMTPLSMALVFALGDRAWPALTVNLSVILPPLLCALLSWAPSQALYRLGAAVQQARRLGSYELSERLGTGGMGEVWRARHRLLARPAAVKLIKPEVLGARDAASRDRVLARFEKEARVTASLDSPHTVELYDFGASASGELFIVMELLDGMDAQTLVERFGPLPSERVVYLLMQACDSLEDAHRRGLVHRDIKPANLFVSRRGVQFDFVKVLDFGLAKSWSSGQREELGRSLAELGDAGQTGVGQIVGTPSFLPPEAAVGLEGIDHRADLYALGCVSYWLLTGTTVFDGPSAMQVVIEHVTRPPEPPSARIATAISAELERITLLCLAKDRADRPGSARELRELLSAVPFAEPWSRERAARWWREHGVVSAPPAAVA
jgi:serine/threonine-protein kinase